MSFTDAFNRWLAAWKGKEAARTGRPIGKIYDKDVAYTMGISQSIVSRWRNGKTTPSKQHCEIIARFFGLPLAEVLAAAGLVTSSSPATVTELLAAAVVESLHWGAEAGDLLMAVRFTADPAFLRSGYSGPAHRILANQQLSVYTKTTLLADLVTRWREEAHQDGETPPSSLRLEIAAAPS